jgi:GT2 family glycosyltransferase
MPIGVTGRLAAVVLNFRTPDDTVLAIQSLLASTRPVDDLIVVDNDSGPGCRDQVAGLHSSIRYLSTGANLGFSGGMNVGIRAALAAGAGVVLLVNSDATVSPECVERLERGLETGVAIAGPIILGTGRQQPVISSGIDYDTATGRMRERGMTPPNQLTAVDAISGCVMLITADVFRKVGVFDPDYFYSFEDIDFCLRARRAGFSVALVPAAIARHAESGTIGRDAAERFYYAARNHLLLASRVTHRGGRLAAIARTATIVSLNFAHALTSRRGRLAQRLSAVFRGTRDYFNGARGPASVV